MSDIVIVIGVIILTSFMLWLTRTNTKNSINNMSEDDLDAYSDWGWDDFDE